MYMTQYRTVTGSINQSLFRGLYQGFGPTIIASMPASAAFFTIYEGLGSCFHRAKAAGHLSGVPLPVLHGVSGAAASLVACLITNPAEVLKQNAQVYRKDPRSVGGVSPTIRTLKHLAKQPTKLWAGYTALVASYLPNTALMFGLYETFKETFLGKDAQPQKHSPSLYILGSGICAAVAGGVSSSFFVPIDVVKTRMRLAVGGDLLSEHRPLQVSVLEKSKRIHSRLQIGPLAVARGIILKEGVPGLFRGVGLTCLASAMGSGLYIGCYEACKIYLS